ncbi:universal stress protein [Mycolicibacterium mengxianglii]|uniref:universal stress protein n=1 Tax=Mycolicibacterium mengxianglii TaxID=2736649 RepID=UPI0018D14210|nr:universal stress protein [Mycolicibacterium mengxianglii]
MTETTRNHGILVGVDGSPASRVAVGWAAREAALHAVPLALVHVEPDDLLMGLEFGAEDGYGPEFSPYAAEIMADASRVVAETAADAQIEMQHVVLHGHVTAALVDVSTNADLIVAGSRGLNRIGRMLLGSVTSGLLRHARCPLAVIHDEDPLMSRPDQAPVVVGIDGSPASDIAAAIAFDEASLRGVDVVAVYAWHDQLVAPVPNETWMNVQPEAERLLAERLAVWREQYPDVQVNRVVVRDRPARQLLAQSENAQLCVVGSHGRGGFPGMLVGSVSAAVAQSARMPVIVARQSGTSAAPHAGSSR